MEELPNSPHRHCTCPHRGHGSTSSGLSVGYLRTRLPWRLLVQTTWSYVLILLLITNFCASQSVGLKSSIPTLSPAGVRTFRYYDTEHDGYAEFYRHITVSNNKLYIGAMNYVIWLDAGDISNYDSVRATRRLNTSSTFLEYQSRCESTHMSSMAYDCQNHIKSIIPLDDGKLEVCGTSAFKPRKFIMDPYNMKRDVAQLYLDSERGLGICPPNPEDSCTTLYVKDGNPGNKKVTYSGTMADFSKTDPIIYRPGISGYSPLLRTEKSDDKWLNEPVFIRSFDVDEYVYIFFRETAIEYMNCGKAIYSRVARICKSDRGGERVLESRFTTFFKSRLNCSIPGEYPFYFNELYDVFRIGDKFHGVFRTNHMGLSGSAVCVFENLEIDKAFDGPFKEQTASTSFWMPVPDNRVPSPRPGRCSDDSQTIADNVLQFTKGRPLMDLSVTSESSQPIFYRQDVMYTHLVIDQVREYTVYFITTDSGDIHKVVTWQRNGAYYNKTITMWNKFTAYDMPIQQMKLYNDYLYVSTDREVLQIPVQQCSGYRYCTQCIQDPYCGWHNAGGQCQNYRHGLIQDVKTDFPESPCSDACKHVNIHEHRVKVHGDPIHFDCVSHCEPSKDVQWHFIQQTDVRIEPDERKYFYTVDNSLIVFNISRKDEGTYQCKSADVIFTEHRLYVNDCDDPESCWRHEFSRWCNEFDTYRKQFEEWQCLKDHCTGDDQCMPSQHVNQCRPPA